MSQLSDRASQLDVVVAKFGSQYWLEVRYLGPGAAPWWDVTAPAQHPYVASMIGVVCITIGSLDGVRMVRCSELNSSQTLRFVVVPTSDAPAKELFEAEARRAIVPIFAL